MVRKSSYYLFLGFLFLIPGQAFSLGLGEIEVNSALNQPLQAQINLISARVEELEEMRVELAPADVFDRVGVPRPFFLTQLKFEAIPLSNGRTAIRVTSKDPVREPFLTFLVEVTWPKGRLLREYTVLLDPPEFAQQQAPQVSTPEATQAPVAEQPATEKMVAQPEPQISTPPETAAPEVVAQETPETTESVVEEPAVTEPVEEDIEVIRARMDEALGIDHSEPVVSTDVQVEEVAEAEPTAEELEEEVVEEAAAEEAEVAEATHDAEPAVEEATQAVLAGEYTTVKGDTLSAIAKASRGSEDVTLNQMMLAIQQANPEAFIKNNINLLKSGVVLRIPDDEVAQNITKQQAIANVSQQNALWREYRGQITEKMVAANVDAPDLVEDEGVGTSDLESEVEAALEETVEETSKQQQDLNILATDEAEQPDSGVTQVAGGEELEKVQKELVLTKELAQSREKENDDLKSRVDALESMLEKKDKIINIQSQQLNDLKEQLSTETEKATAAEEKLKEQSIEKAPAETEQETAAPAPQEQVAEIKPPVVEPLPDFEELETELAAEQPVFKPKVDPLPDWDTLPDIEVPAEEAVVAEAEVEAAPEAEPETTPEEKPAQPQPEPTSTVAETTAVTGVMAMLMGFVEPVKQHWTKIAAGLGAIAVIGGLLSIRRRRSAQRIQTIGMGMPEVLEDDEFDDILDETIVTQKEAPAAEPEPAEEPAFEPTASFDSEAETPEATSGESVIPDDVLEEADVYISYGLHQQAQDLLTDAIAAEPNRNDYKVKLAEVFYSSKDQEGFEQHAQSVKDQLGESSSEWQNISAMGKEILPASALFAGAAAAADAFAEPPDTAEIDVNLQTGINEHITDDDLEDTVVDNSESKDDGLDFDLDADASATSDNLAAATDTGTFESDEFEDDPVASKIMEANETSDILNFEVDDLADDLEDQVDTQSDMEAVATGLHEATSIQEAIDMGDMTEELEEVGLQTTMDDLQPLDMDEESMDTTVALQTDEDFDIGMDTATTPADPDATSAYIASNQDQDDTEQFDASNIDTEFLDPAEATVAQTATDLHELGPPSLIEEVGTKLDLAKAFVDMGDSDAAKETLLEVINEGDESQVKAAKDLMDKLGS